MAYAVGAMRLRGSAAVIAIVLVAAPARAQVNAEAIRAQLSTNTKMLNVDASIATRSGNTKGTTFSGGVLAAIVRYRHLAFFRAQADYANASGINTVSSAFLHARYNYTLTSWLSWEAYAQLQSDRFRRLGLREVAGTGPRAALVHTDELEVFVATSYMLENEVLVRTETPPDGRHQDFYQRSSTYAGLNYSYDAKTQFTTVTYFQPRFARPHDFRVLHESAAMLGITKLLAVKLGVSFRYDNEPPIGVVRYDIEIKNSLALRF